MMEDKQTKIDMYSNLKSIKVEEQKELALYVHIPFCERKCNYCNFVSFCNCADKIDDYIDALIKEMQMRKQSNAVLKTIYIGGGTPSILNVEQVEKLFNAIKQNYQIKEDAEITIEVNPNSITNEKLLKYKEVGINRISVGVQSLNNSKLELLGRLHSSSQALIVLNMINKIGFENISCDLIINLPKQSNSEIKKDIKILSKYAKHLSVYGLSIENGTKFFEMKEKGQLKLPSEEKSVKQYQNIVKYLKKLGYDRYEVSNFALQGYESKHNNTYWKMDDYLGLGVASHSFLDNVRYVNTEDLDVYINCMNEYKPAFTTEEITNDKLIEETIMLGLRMSSGIDLQMLKTKYKLDLLNEKKNDIALLKSLKLIEVSDGHLKATSKGFTLLNQIILKLL